MKLYTARVSRIIDGDTFVTEYGETVRLEGVDSAEINTSMGQRASTYLTMLIYGFDVKLESKGKDVYGRTIAQVYRNSDNLNVNAQMVRSGYAKDLYVKTLFSH